MVSQPRVPILRQPYAQRQRGRQFTASLPACPISTVPQLTCCSPPPLGSSWSPVAGLANGQHPDTDHMKVGQQASQGWSPQ